MPNTILDKVWDEHVVARSPEGLDLLHVDRSLLTDLSGTVGLEDVAADGRAVAVPGLHMAVPDHAIGTDPNGDDPRVERRRARFVGTLEALSGQAGVRHLGRGSGRQGIVHVTGLERAFSLPGLTVVCGDSHTSTQGAVGALAWGIGSTETKHVLATQTLWLKKPRQARIHLDGALSRGVSAKDVILWLIGRLGADYGREHLVEFAGPLVEAMSVEGRATICNLAVELGARFGIVGPDEVTFSYLHGRDFAPKGQAWDAAVAHWRTLRTEDGACFDKQAGFDVNQVAPQITWGTSPEQVIDIDGRLPPPGKVDATVADYIGLAPGQPIAGVPVDYVFIGSCANSRIEDLRAAAEVVRGRRVADSVQAWVVPGSEAVRSAAEREGLDAIFRDAGFQWRLPGCSMCVGANGDVVPPGKRCVSTSNRNFMGRQGPNSRTHLASPATAAASAIRGAIADPRGTLRDGSAAAA